jgi:hypothetical protein
VEGRCAEELSEVGNGVGGGIEKKADGHLSPLPFFTRNISMLCSMLLVLWNVQSMWCRALECYAMLTMDFSRN